MKFMLITNDSRLAAYAEDCGIGRIFIDLEVNGKEQRQGHLDTLKSVHSMQDIVKIRVSVQKIELLVRLNPLHNNTQNEINQAIELGADLLMLPMFRSAQELNKFSKMVNARVGIIPLVETHSAMLDMVNIVKVSGLSEVYIGLNDLHLDMDLKFMFEPLASGMVDTAATIIRQAGLSFGFGGIARVGEGEVPSELVLAEHMRLGSSSVILSRTFHRNDNNMKNFNHSADLKQEMDKLFSVIKTLELRDKNQVEIDCNKLKKAVKKVVKNRD